jgi:glycosyltransferase involved in cell wall biosynthesis
MTEALACGLPVVTTRVGGNPEVVRHGVDGLLVPFWDARAFGDAVLQALETEWDRTAIAARAAERRWERTAEAVVDEFRHATGWRNHGLEPVLGR